MTRDARAPFPAFAPRRLLPLLAALPCLAASALGLGRWVPGLAELLAVAALAGAVAWIPGRLRAGWRPSAAEFLLLAGAVTLSTVAVLAGGLAGFGTPSPAALAHLLVTRTQVAAAGAAAALAVHGVWPQLAWIAGWWRDVPPPPGQLPLARGWTRGTWIVLVVALLAHGAVLCAHPGALIQVDSAVNVWEPPLFTYSEKPHHHTPLYAELIKVANACESPARGLWWVVVLQHAAGVATALLVERTARLAARSPLAGGLAGVFVACDGHLSLYAQMIMSETLSILLLVASTACLLEAPRRRSAARWLLASGLLAAAATLTRQAAQAWFIAGALTILLMRFPHRGRALTLFLAGALLPVLALILHNGVFTGRYSLTAGLGRTLHYRVAKGLPDLTDVNAPPGDPYERARELIWEVRDAGWIDSYSAIREELGWDDAQIERAMKRFYGEQIRKYPVPFTRVTFEYAIAMLRGRETGEGAIGFHNLSLANLTMWSDVPRGDPEGAAVNWLHAFQPTSSWVVLFLAVISPLLARGRGRILACMVFLSVGYFIGVAALVEVPIIRYRLPGVPFIAIGCALSVARILVWVRTLRGRSA